MIAHIEKQARFIGLCFLAFLAGCDSTRQATAPQGASSSGGYYKVGRPYQIKGNWYYPKEDYTYDETGIASWYGDDFHNKQTANGEVFNKNELTAAHKTLPMPSLARVTNLENGRAIVVRINDRGPYSGARIIDMSHRAAQLLGFDRQGTAKVRVQVLADESRAIAEAMRTYGSSGQMQTASLPSAGQQPSVEVFDAPSSSYTSASSSPVEQQTLTPPSFQSPAPSIQTVKPVPQYVQMPVTGDNLIYIQAGAFTNPENATRLSNKLASVGSVKVVQALVKGTQYYRVRVGPIGSVQEADKMLARVTKSGAEGARIIVD